MNNNKTTNISVNYLKTIALICVYLCHSLIVTLEISPFNLERKFFFFKSPAWGGVWIFFIVSGFLSAKGFYDDKYKLNKEGIIEFYKSKFISVLIPTWIFISLVFIFIEPENLSVSIVVRLLTCTFNGSGSNVTGIGATWYVFTLMWLYLLTPLFIFIINKLNIKYKDIKKTSYINLAILLIIGITYRIGGRLLGLDWYSKIYISVIGNLDLYISGIQLNILNRNIAHNRKHSRISFAFLIALLLFCSCAFYNGGTLLHIYMYVCPSLILIFVGIILINSENKKVNKSLDTVTQFISNYSFEFYLWHSLILYRIIPAIKLNNSFEKYLIITIVVAIITMYVAYLMTMINKTIKRRLGKYG